MKRVFIFIAAAVVTASCNIDVKTEKKDGTSKLDSFVQKADTTLEKWGDSAKEKFKDLKQDVKKRFAKDSASKLQ